MLHSFTSVMARRLGIKIAPPVRSSVSARVGSRFRPRLEECESREVPATFAWQGGALVGPTSALVAANWVSPDEPGGLPGAGDMVLFTTPIAVLVGGGGTDGEPPPPPPPAPPMYDCVGLVISGRTSSGDQFAAVSISAAYTGTVVFGEALATGSFALAGGAIAQPTVGTDLTVTGTFTWTGGTLNSSTNLATLTLDGATGTIAPASAGTVLLGSNLSFAGGADVTVKEGTIDPNKDGVEISTSTGASLNFSPDTVTTILLGALRELNGTIGSGTPWTVKAGTSVTHTGKLANNDGTLTLLAGATATITGKGGDDIAYLQNGLTSATLLYGGSTLATGEDKFAVINQGILATVYADGTANATIRSDKLKIQGGDIYIAYQGGNNRFGQLLVDGNILWDGGTFHAKVYCDGATCDSLRASNANQNGGQFDIDSGIVKPIYIDSDYGTSSLPSPGDAWEVLQAGGGFVDNTAPSVSDASAWEMRMDNSNPPIFWKVVAK